MAAKTRNQASENIENCPGEKPIPAKKVAHGNPSIQSDKPPRQTKFVEAMRNEIFRLTDYDVEVNDSIYPLLACISLVGRLAANEVHNRDERHFRELEKNILAVLKKHYGENGPGKKKTVLMCAIFALVGLIIGAGIGFFIRMQSGL